MGSSSVAVVIFAILASTKGLPKLVHAILYFVVVALPAIYICKGNYGLLFKKVKLGDFKTIIICLIGYLIYCGIVSLFLKQIGYITANNANTGLELTFISVVSMLLQLAGEEFYKILILLIVMYVAYRFTNNRSMSIYIGIIGTLLVFGLSHYAAYSGRILQILLNQGIGTIFNLYVYMKTKNFVASYILHLMIDLIGFVFSAGNAMALVF